MSFVRCRPRLPLPSVNGSVERVFRAFDSKDYTLIDDMIARGEVDIAAGHPKTLVTVLMKAVSLGLPAYAKVRRRRCL
jgi:hypothetical protein